MHPQFSQRGFQLTGPGVTFSQPASVVRRPQRTRTCKAAAGPASEIKDAAAAKRKLEQLAGRKHGLDKYVESDSRMRLTV